MLAELRTKSSLLILFSGGHYAVEKQIPKPLLHEPQLPVERSVTLVSCIAV